MHQSTSTAGHVAELMRVMVVQITGLEDSDIMFMRFQGEGGPHCLPYFICLDHEKQAVVVSIRGTLSLEDAVTGAPVLWNGSLDPTFYSQPIIYKCGSNLRVRGLSPRGHQGCGCST